MSEETKKEPPRKVGYYHSPHTNVIYRFVLGDERNPEQELPKPLATFNRDTGVLTYLCEDYRMRFHSPVMNFMRKKWSWEAKEVTFWQGDGIMPIPAEPEPIQPPSEIKIQQQEPEQPKIEILQPVQVSLEPEKPKEPEVDRSTMPPMPDSNNRNALVEWVKRWWPSVPQPPTLSPNDGDKTPEFVNWISLYFPAEFRERYGVEGEGDLVETVSYLDREGVWRSKKVTRRVLFAKRKTCITEKRQ